jgi:transcription elongation factor GreA
MPMAVAFSARRSRSRTRIPATAVTYQIVGEDEADIKAGKISVNSPMARALIGKYAGDIAQVQAPGGIREYEIIDVRYE